MVHLSLCKNWSKLKTIASVHATNVQFFYDLFTNLIKFSETELDCFIQTKNPLRKVVRNYTAKMHPCLLFTIEL